MRLLMSVFTEWYGAEEVAGVEDSLPDMLHVVVPMASVKIGSRYSMPSARAHPLRVVKRGVQRRA